MRTLYTTVLGSSMDLQYESILNVNDKDLDKASGHPAIVMEQVKVIFEKVFVDNIGLGYPVEDSWGSYGGSACGTLELGNIETKNDLERLVKGLMKELKLIKINTKLKKDTRKVKNTTETWYDVMLPDLPDNDKWYLHLTFYISVSSYGSVTAISVSAPKPVLQ